LCTDASQFFYVHSFTQHFVVSSIKDLFENVEAQNFIDFIKENHVISNFNVFVLLFVIYFLF